MRGAWVEIAAARTSASFAASLPVRGAWVEMRLVRPLVASPASPSLPVRGAWVEICQATTAARRTRSLPVRGAWVEIACCVYVPLPRESRSPCGERGLKYLPEHPPLRGGGRSPCGERGLKLPAVHARPERRGRSPCGERGLKFRRDRAAVIVGRSLPVRGAWVEMCGSCRRRTGRSVAPRAGSVG